MNHEYETMEKAGIARDMRELAWVFFGAVVLSLVLFGGLVFVVLSSI